ncbi:MAG: type II secretion system minor pseudopilin GspJ, partial [Pseudomonadota bacterium]|nr:type II secretion system minor pseudopilin GspJ [Pseudomonadota bacterium]
QRTAGHSRCARYSRCAGHHHWAAARSAGCTADDTMNQPPAESRIRHAGFTLVEILVALLILAIMSALGYSTYRTARISAERTELSLQRSREIEFGMRVMASDFAQLVPRPVRDILGSQNRLSPLRGTPGAGSVTVTSASLGAATGSGSTSGLSFNSGPNPSPGLSFNSGSGFGATTDPSAVSMVDLTRAGWSNTAGQQRSTLQRVSYALVGEVLRRSYQTNLDTVQGNKPVVQDLLTGVKGVQLRYLDANQSWQSQWPENSTLQGGANATPDQSRPVAVEIIIQFKDWGPIRRVIEVAG